MQRFQRKLALGKHLAQQQDRQQDIGLLETGDNMHVLMRNGKVQENSAWAYVKLKDDQHRLALKLSTSDKPNDFRYYGFHWSVMTMDGHAGYLCQHSTKAEGNPEHTVETYMQKFTRREFKREQTYHITLVHKEDSISGRLFSEGLVA